VPERSPPASLPYVTPPLRSLAVSERPQERQERLGAKALADRELLAMLLRSGSAGRNVLQVADELLAQAGGQLGGMLAWTAADFRKIKGVGRVKAQQLVSVLEVAHRILRAERKLPEMLDRPEAVYAFMQAQADLATLAVEKCWALSLNRRNRLIECVEISSGTATQALLHPREFFRTAIRSGAVAVIAAHNHPSGDPSPSDADLRITRQLRDTAQAIAIDLTDHLILGRPEADPNGRGWFSFREAGVL
jgi:DNA repair protein RadC